MLPRGLLSDDQAKEIKELLWAGHLTQGEIAVRFNVSQPTISRIFRGRDWSQLPWPDGSLGHIPKERRNTIHASRHRKTRYQHDGRTGAGTINDKEVEGITEVVVRLLAEQDENLRHLVSKKASESRKRPTRSSGKPFSGDMLPWPDIKEQDPGHPIVQKLSDGETDEPLKVALRIVCAKIAKEDWQKPAVLDMIQQKSDEIRKQIS